MNYDSLSVNTYSHGTTAYSTAGASDTNGYKWYCRNFLCHQVMNSTVI